MGVYSNIAILAGFGLVYLTVAGRLERSMFGGALIFTAFGYLAGPHGAEFVNLDTEPETYRLLVELTLACVLFSDAAQADLEVLRATYRAPLRLLGLGLPLTILFGFAAALVVLPVLTPIEAALLATMLAPTDAALGKAVVVDPVVPARVRSDLNVESGLNDGICVPIMLVLLTLADAGWGVGAGAMLFRAALEQIGIAVAIGAAVTVASHLLLAGTTRVGWAYPRARSGAPLLLAAGAFALAQSLGGSGFVAAFVGGFVWGQLDRGEPGRHGELDEAVGDLLAYLTWVIFGAVVVGPLLTQAEPRVVVYALLSLTLVRMLPTTLVLTGLDYPVPERLFIGWFGPRGLATIVFGIMTAEANLPGGSMITTAAATTVLLSVILHGATAEPLAARFGKAVVGAKSVR